MQAPHQANALEVGGLPQTEAAQQDVAAAAQELAHPSADPSMPSQATEVLRVSTRSRPSAVAGAIAGVMRERGCVEVQSIGAGATNQAIKAVAIAHSYLWDEGIKLCCVPAFITITIDGDARTGIQLLVQQRPA